MTFEHIVWFIDELTINYLIVIPNIIKLLSLCFVLRAFQNSMEQISVAKQIAVGARYMYRGRLLNP